MRFTTQFCYSLVKVILETVMLVKKAYKGKYFGESSNFRWHGDFKIGCLSVELAFKSDQPESAVNKQKTVWVILQENRQMICEEIAASTNISKTSIFRILNNNLQLHHAYFR